MNSYRIKNTRLVYPTLLQILYATWNTKIDHNTSTVDDIIQEILLLSVITPTPTPTTSHRLL